MLNFDDAAYDNTDTFVNQIGASLLAAQGDVAAARTALQLFVKNAEKFTQLLLSEFADLSEMVAALVVSSEPTRKARLLRVSTEIGKILSIVRLLLCLNATTPPAPAADPAQRQQHLSRGAAFELQQFALSLATTLLYDFSSMSSNANNDINIKAAHQNYYGGVSALHPDARASLAVFFIDWRQMFPPDPPLPAPTNYITVERLDIERYSSRPLRELLGVLLATAPRAILAAQMSTANIGSGERCFASEAFTDFPQAHPRAGDWQQLISSDDFVALPLRHQSSYSHALRLSMEWLLANNILGASLFMCAAAAGMCFFPLSELVVSAAVSSGKTPEKDRTAAVESGLCRGGLTAVHVAAFAGNVPAIIYGIKKTIQRAVADGMPARDEPQLMKLKMAQRANDGTTLTAVACLGGDANCAQWCALNGGGDIPTWFDVVT